MSLENRLTDRDMAIEGYGQDYKGVLPDGTVTGIMSYDGKVFKHYVESGENTWRHPRWERDYESTPLWYALEILGDGASHTEMETAEVNYNGTYYPSKPMESCGMSGWRYDYHDKMRFRRLVLRGEISLPAPAVFSRFGNIYTVEGYEEETQEQFWTWARSNGNQSPPKTKSGAD